MKSQQAANNIVITIGILSIMMAFVGVLEGDPIRDHIFGFAIGASLLGTVCLSKKSLKK